MTVNVTDLVEDGTITLSSRQPQVTTAFTATLSDPNIDNPCRHMGVGEVD